MNSSGDLREDDPADAEQPDRYTETRATSTESGAQPAKPSRLRPGETIARRPGLDRAEGVGEGEGEAVFLAFRFRRRYSKGT